MAKRRPAVAPATPQESNSPFASHPPRLREVDLLAGAAAILCIGVAILSRDALNPDGVSYLDLASAVQGGHWSQLVQGYWSPLYPLLVAAIGTVGGWRLGALVPVSHWLSLAAALTAVAVIWRRGRQLDHPLFARASLAGFLLCSAGMPRLEAVTPDLLLLLVMVLLSLEWLGHGERRWWWIGALLGTAFLVKTSIWPWWLVALPLRWWAAETGPARRTTLKASALSLLIALCWIVPMSSRVGHLTLGSSARLNYSWYINGSTSRLPDTDLGENRNYEPIPVGANRQLILAHFPDVDAWTYQPWGDPTAWHADAVNDDGTAPTAGEMVEYWLRQAGRVFGLWTLPLWLLCGVVPLLLQRRRGMLRELRDTQRAPALVMLLGVTGLLQFVAVHAEPRLLAPFALMLGLGAAAWSVARAPDHPWRRSRLAQAASWLGLLAGLGVAVPKLVDGVRSTRHIAQVADQLAQLRTRLEAGGVRDGRVAIVGAAAPVLSAAYLAGLHVVAQLPPRSAATLLTLSTDQRSALLTHIFAGHVRLIWLTSGDGGIQMLLLPAAATP
jgi:hypothetical protein